MANRPGKVRIEVEFPEKVALAIDRARKLVPRATFIRAIVEAAVLKRRKA